MKRTIALPLTAFALLAAACSSAAPTADTSPSSDTTSTENSVPSTTDPAEGRVPVTSGSSGTAQAGPVGFADAALMQFDDCAAFLDHVHAVGVEEVGPYGFGGDSYYPPGVFRSATDDDVIIEMDAGSDSDGKVPDDATPAAGESSADEGDAGGDGSFSDTNVQVDGVDEPDIVKTDGDRILAITGDTLYYVEISADGTTGTKRGEIRLQADGNDAYRSGYEIFIAGDRAYVFAGSDGYSDFGPMPIDIMEDDVVQSDVAESDAEADLVDPPTSIESDVEAPRPVGSAELGGPQTLVIEIDLTDPDALTIVDTLSVDGRYVSARAIGDTARLVVTTPPQDLGFLYPSSPSTEDKALEANRQVVLDSTIEDWLPGYTLTDAQGEVTSGDVVDCANLHAPADFSGFDMLSILTLDLGAGLDASTAAGPLAGSSVMASGDTVYASQDRMYVTTNIWEPIIDDQTDQWLDENYRTNVHRFSISGDGPATYEASGLIEGHLLNQFSMNDRDGVFYAATTTGAPWGGGDDSESRIVALEANGDRLEEIGSVGGLGKTEQIRSVRYVGTTAYVVTFRQTDPFYVLDLTDPRNMTVQGELKIPGFSSYLHPISETMVLGVGQDASEDGRTTGTKVSLFDVADPANPVELDVWTLPDGFSDAEFDHRAFLWWAPTSTAVLPLQSYTDLFAGAVVLQVVDGKLVEQGRISHDDEADGPVGQTDCRVLTAEEIGADSDNEFFWTNENGGQVQACGADDEGGAIGQICNPIPLDDLADYYWDGDDGTIGDLLAGTDADRIEICYPDWNGYETAVQRTLVIDSSVWTLSTERLQANDLTSLERTAAIGL